MVVDMEDEAAHPCMANHLLLVYSFHIKYAKKLNVNVHTTHCYKQIEKQIQSKELSPLLEKKTDDETTYG